MFAPDPHPAIGTASPASRAAADPGDVAFILGVLIRQRRVIFVTTLAALTIGLLVLFFSPSSYKASSTVLVDFKRLSAVDENFSTPTGRIDSSAVLSQIELLKSLGVLSRVVLSEKLDEDPEFIGSASGPKRLLAVLGIAEDPAAEPQEERRRVAIEALRKVTTTERVDLSYAISITVTARTGDKAARLANALAQAYIDDQLEAKRIASEKASNWFSERIAELQDRVTKADRAVIEYRIRNNIVTIDGRFIDEQQILDLSQKVVGASSARSGAEAKVAQIDEIAKTGGVQNALVEEFSNEVIIALRNAYFDAKRQMTDLSVRYGATHEAVIRVRAKMNELQSSMNDEIRRILEAARTELRVAQINQRSLEKELADLSARSIQSRERRVQLMQLESAAETVKSIRDTFMSRYVDGIQKQSFPMTEARIITAAQAPTSRSFPTTIKALGGGLVFGFGAGCLLAVAREAFSRRLRFRRQIEEAIGAPSLGFLPEIARSQPAVPDAQGLRTAIGGFGEEVLRGIKVGIDLRRLEKPVLIGVVSAGVGEGKSVTASTFAQLCAGAGARTLLIDANARHPSLSDQLAPARETGLSEVVEQTATLTDAVRTLRDPNLFFLPCFGKVRPEQPGQILSAQELRHLIESLKTQYHYIIVDLPAIGAVSDAEAVADIVDGFLVVARWDETRSYALEDALRNNPKVREKVVGGILNRANLKRLTELGESSVANAAAYHA
ncbi:GumC family protein [Methylorubrum extorquens]